MVGVGGGLGHQQPPRQAALDQMGMHAGRRLRQLLQDNHRVTVDQLSQRLAGAQSLPEAPGRHTQGYPAALHHRT
ncbi:hypothetical protein G6F66_015406 [Rhizopus arrhizus]|nr:hypothetical protein G6F66_015406 [Rhizopus arrhizus]